MNLDVSNTAYGQGQITSSNTIVINKSFDSFVKFEQARSETQKRLAINDPTICRLMKFTTSEQKSFCGQLFGLQLQYQYTRKCLADVKSVSEFDCMSIIRDITHALLLFIEKRIRHGYLSPQTILISQKYQLTDIRFITDMYEYKMQLIGFTSSCYLAPNLVYELGKRTLNPIYNHEKSEVFSLGLVVLELAIQQSVQSIYDLSRFFVSQDLINNYLKIAAQKYSSQMVNLLSRMLQVDEDQRIDLYQLDKLVNQRPAPQNSINLDKYVNNSTTRNAYTSSQSPKPLTPTRSIFQNTYSTNNYSTIHFEKSPNTMTFYKQGNLDSSYQTKKSQNTNYFESNHTIKRDNHKLDTGESYRDNRRIKTEYDTQEPYLHQHSESFISPTRKPDHQMDQLFTQFDQNLQKVKQKIHHLRINTPTSQSQSHFAESVDEFPTFKPSAIPNKIDVGLNNDNVLKDLQYLESKIYDFSALEKPNYISNSYYDDMAREARLPDSGTIHLHSRSPASLSDFFFIKK